MRTLEMMTQLVFPYNEYPSSTRAFQLFPSPLAKSHRPWDRAAALENVGKLVNLSVYFNRSVSRLAVSPSLQSTSTSTQCRLLDRLP
jgi:hypothetical protein